MHLKTFLLYVAVFFLSLLPASTAQEQASQPEKAITKINQQKLIPDIDISLSKPFKPGGSIIVWVTSQKELVNPQVSFAGKTSKLYKIDETRYRGITGIDANASPGGYTIKLADETGHLNYSKIMEASPGHFPIQNIRISGTKAGLKATEDELQKVSEAKENLTDSNYWIDRPFKIPTSGCIISVYGLNRYHNGKPTGNYHKGIDIKAPSGNPVYAMAGGKVLIAEDFRLHGKTVAIDHGQGLMSIYIHLNRIDVKKDDILTKDEQIGTVGSTGFATGPHLHWGVYINGVDVNPVDWVGPISKCR